MLIPEKGIPSLSSSHTFEERLTGLIATINKYQPREVEKQA